uniref:Uncharacterized protein n=1 Tax=Arundo donax TaxID=35708 RepID=A0A0A9AGU8_ARUDO
MVGRRWIGQQSDIGCVHKALGPLWYKGILEESIGKFL